MGALQNFLKRRGKTKPKRDEFDEAAVELKKRADDLWKQQTNPTAGPTATLIESLAVFVRTLGAASASADRVTKVIVWLTVVGVVVALTNVALEHRAFT